MLPGEGLLDESVTLSLELRTAFERNCLTTDTLIHALVTITQMDNENL